MRRPLMTLAAGGFAAVLLLGGGLAFWYARPTVLTVAISRHDLDDTALIAAVDVQLKRERKTIRLRPVEAEDATDASASVDAGQADLAVVRTDVALPSYAQTVVVLHRDAAIIVALASSDLHELSDLPGHRIGILRDGPANSRLLDAALAQAEIKTDTVPTEALQPGEVADALRDKRVDAVMMVDVVSSPTVREIVKAAAAVGGGPPIFIPVSEASAIAQRSPGYEPTTVVKGAFGGSPPRPAEEFDTLSVTHRLVANENVDQGPIAALTRFILTERSTVAATFPMARQIEAPSTDKGSALPVHPGAAAYIDDEEQTFFDKYSDMIYIGAMALGVLASGATALFSRVNGRKSAALDGSIGRLLEMLSSARAETSNAGLDALQAEADDLLISALAIGGGSGDDGRGAAFALVLDQVHAAIRDRRAFLRAEPPVTAARQRAFAGASAALE